jgi:hypothetical protein
VARGWPGEPYQRHEVAHQRFGRVLGPRASLGEGDDGLFHRDEVGSRDERLRQVAGRRVGPLVERERAARAQVPAGEEVIADRTLRRHRPADDSPETACSIATVRRRLGSGPCLRHARREGSGDGL